MKQPVDVSKNIKQARTMAGLSQQELAKKLGISNKTVSAYETGRAMPPTPTLTRISEITGKPLSELVGLKSKDEDKLTARLKEIKDYFSETTITPRTKVDAFVGVVLVDDQDRIYLIKEADKYNISLGRWNLPGGSVDGNESLLDSAQRETGEETGYKAEVTEMLGCYKCKKGDYSWLYTVFKAELRGEGEAIQDTGVEDGRWFSRDEFLNLDQSKIVHPDMKAVYKIAIENKGLNVDTVKYIDYDKE